MAQPINCDAAGEVHPADVIVSRLADGDTAAWCDEHYVEVCLAIADAVGAAERQATDSAALAALGAAGSPEPDKGPEPGETPAPDGAGSGDPDAFPTSGDSSDEDTAPAEPPGEPASGPQKPEPPVGATRTRKSRPEPSLGG